MKAIVVHAFTEPEQLTLGELPDPHVGDDSVVSSTLKMTQRQHIGFDPPG